MAVENCFFPYHLISFPVIYNEDASQPARDVPGDVPRRSPKGPNIRDLQETFRGLSGDQHKN